MAHEQQPKRGVATDITEDAGPAIFDPSIVVECVCGVYLLNGCN